MKVSIIAAMYILNDKMADITRKMIVDINKSRSDDTEFIIIDNNSTHGIDDMINGADRYVRLKENRGWGGGLNVGMQLAKGEYLVLANNDIRIEPGWIEKMIEKFESNLKIGAISTHDRNGFSGALFGIRKEIYEKIGGFDEKTFPLGHAQDCDFLYRLMKEGWDDYVIVDKSFEHMPRQTYNQKEFKDKYADHLNFGKSEFKRKWGFKDQEWEKMGHKHWREAIEKNPKLDRYNELKHAMNWLADYNKSMGTIGATFLGRPVGQTFSSFFIWEKILTQYEFKRIIEFGTWKGNLSLYLLLYCLSENAEFHTYDKEKMTTYCEDKIDTLKSKLEFDKYFEQIDIFKNESKIADLIQQDGRTILFCDNGKKVKEFNTFAKFLKKDDIIGVHDWDSEIRMKEIEETCQKCKLKMIFEKECSENTTITRFFIKYE